MALVPVWPLATAAERAKSNGTITVDA